MSLSRKCRSSLSAQTRTSPDPHRQKKSLPTIPSVHDMIVCTRILNSKRPCHRHLLAGHRQFVNSKDLTPYSSDKIRLSDQSQRSIQCAVGVKPQHVERLRKIVPLLQVFPTMLLPMASATPLCKAFAIPLIDPPLSLIIRTRCHGNMPIIPLSLLPILRSFGRRFYLSGGSVLNDDRGSILFYDLQGSIVNICILSVTGLPSRRGSTIPPCAVNRPLPGSIPF